MADETTNEDKISFKVTVDKVRKRVLYAVADHTFVDILFSFITLPMGTIVRLLQKDDDKKFEAFRSLSNLYQSLNDFPERYLSTEECQFMLLNPRSLSYCHCTKLKLKLDDTEPMKVFVCNSYRCTSQGKFMFNPKVSGKDCDSERCCSCSQLMKLIDVTWNPYVCDGGGVFVSYIATFIITDDLCVEPYTSASSIRLLADFEITHMDCLEERIIEMSSYQMLHFLKMVLSIDCPLTYLVFNKIENPLRKTIGSGKDSILDHNCDFLKKEVSASSKMHLEVSLQKSTGKLLFAEAKEDLVEFLFSILSIPLGTVIGTLMNGTSSLSCMDNIFKSISNMSVGRYLKSQDLKDMLLESHIGQQFTSKYQLFSLKGVPIQSSVSKHIDPRIDGGLLKQSGMFIVTDDLTIAPSSSFSAIEILKKLEVSPVDIETHEATIGLKEGLSLLKASLRSCSTLTKSLEHQMKK